MILTVCLSPCIDVNIEVDSLAVGKTHNIINKRVFFTGKALNVAIGIARISGSVFATGFMYEGNGNQFEIELHREGVPYKFIWNEGRVRENYKFVDNKSMLTEINDVSPAISEKSQDELVNLVCRLAKGMAPEYYDRILSAVPENVLKVVDTEGERLRVSLKHGIDLVKPNLEELERTLERRIKSKEDLLEGCRELINCGAKRVLLSLGKQGAVITDGKKSYYSKSVNVAMNSTVGAGDGMVAAAVNALVKGSSLQEILCCGVAAGTAAVTSPNSISFSKIKYEEILSALTVKEI